ncbi:redoxin domain-containing protein [Aureispira anguillae]|nr:redoxin domain-containing protein [Aureispira anguillae]
MKLCIVGAILCWLSATSIAQKNTFSKDEHKKIQTFIQQISAVYNNQAQADTTENPLLRLSEIRIFEIWTHKKNEYWLSIGWYQPDFPEQPMGEKIFHIKSIRKDTFELDCYSWTDPSNSSYLLQWKEKHPYKKKKLEHLTNDGCQNYVVKNSSGGYELKTLKDQVCAFNNPMAPFDGLFFHFIFDPTGQKMDIYDKNYKAGKVLFHYLNTPMLMRKTTPVKSNNLEEKKQEQATDDGRLKRGDKPEAFVVEDVLGNTISLRKILKKNKVLLVFLRHAWCPVCNYRTHELIGNYNALKEAGYEVVVVYESSKKSLLPYVEDHDLPYFVIADPQRELYKAFKVEFSSEKMLKSRTNTKMLTHYKKGMELFGDRQYAKEKGEEKSSIIPADFIINKDRTLETVYYGEYIGDHLPVKELLEGAGSSSGHEIRNRF